MAQSYNVNALPDYVEQKREELIAKSVLGAKTASMITLMTGVKGQTALNLIDTTVTFGNGYECGWNEEGQSTLSQRVLDPAALKVNMAICDKNLLKKWAGYLVRVEAGKTDRDLPFEKEFIDGVLKDVKAKLENMIWTGDGNGNSFKGFLHIIDNDGAISVDYARGRDTGAYEAIKETYAKLPSAVAGADDLVIFVSDETYREFMQDLVAANLYHYDPNNGEDGYKLPGSNVPVIPVSGLNGRAQKDVIIGRLSNFFYGTNLEDGEEIFDLWYSKDNREFRLAIEFVAGVQVAYPNEIVHGQGN